MEIRLSVISPEVLSERFKISVAKVLAIRCGKISGEEKTIREATAKAGKQT
ncbi:MAG: hypothetical protein AAFX06_10200 [Planctomycetota bacterium]